ncbi:MAG: YfhO family protein, partial [Bacteroidota bacterium]
QKYYINFLRDMGVIDATDEDQTRWARGVRPRPLLQVWSSHKYMLNKTGQDFNFPLFRKIQTVGDVDIYRNDFFLDFGFTYDQVTPKSAIASMDYLKKDITILRSAIIDDEDSDLLSQFPAFPINSIPGNYTPDLVVNDINARRSALFQMTDFSEKAFAGTIQTDQRKLLCFTTPYDKGWSAKIDGQSAPIRKINIGFMGLVIEPGQHTIEMRYTPQYYWLSVLISILSLGLWGFLFWRSKNTTE